MTDGSRVGCLMDHNALYLTKQSKSIVKTLLYIN